MASTQGGNGNFDFNAGAGIDFTGFGMQPVAYNDLKGPCEGNTSSAFFFGDEGIDTASSTFDHSFDSMFAPTVDMNFSMEPLGLDNTSGTASWGDVNSTFPATPMTSLDSLYTPQYTSTLDNSSALGKHPLQLDVQDFPQAKRHEAFPSPFSTATSITGSNWAFDTPSAPSTSDVGLSDEAADVCATWFSKYNILPSDRHIDSLSQLTGESSTAIRHWFGQALKQGMNGHDSAYKSQTGFTQEPLFHQIPQTTTEVAPQQLENTETSCNHETQTATTTTQSPLRGGKKGCNPTEDPELLKRDPNKIYQCTRKCGKRYGRKCDWKRNEEEGYPSKSWICSLCISEGVERVKPCFRKYHFSQHFRNIHPNLNSADYEESSIVHSDTSFPRKCGFCTHRFTSRQDRIDHIAEHFKNGKCMLDWNDDDDDNNDSDNTDDDDNDEDRPDSGGGDFGNGKSFFPPNNDQHGSGPKSNGNGGNGLGPQPSQNGFYQFHISQFADADTRGASPGGDQHIISDLRPTNPMSQLVPCSSRYEETNTAGTEHTSNIHDSNCSIQGSGCSMQDRDSETTEYDTLALAGDVLSKSVIESDSLHLPGIPQYVPPIDGDPLPDRLRTPSPLSNRPNRLPPSCPSTSESESVSMQRQLQRQLLRQLEAFSSRQLLGAGGFSTVDEVQHRETGLRVSRKTLKALKSRDQSARSQLQKEVNVLQKLRHPHIIRFMGIYKDAILLSPVAETTLAVWLDNFKVDRPQGLSETIMKMLGCLTSSVRYLHEQRPIIKHMDIKPQNVLLVMQQGQEDPHVVLSDFGISSTEDDSTNSNGKAIPLTRKYCAPEVSDGTSRDVTADIWSLGCVFLEMAAVAFSEDNPQWLEFRKQFSGRKGKYYWQDVHALQELLTKSNEQAKSQREVNVARTVKTMLRAQPDERPDAAALAMIFTPGPCCLSWPNEKEAYPGPHEELQAAGSLSKQDGHDCHRDNVHSSVDRAKQWMHECADHEVCRLESSRFKSLPTRLVDLQSEGSPGVVRIVDSADLDPNTSQDYVAVSYLWTEHELKLSASRLSEMERILPLEELSPALNEAIAKAQQSGFRYMWVDSLCVLQDSEKDKRHECHKMADVFRNAALTMTLHQFTKKQGGSERSDHGGTDAGQTRLANSLPIIDFLTPGLAYDTRAWVLQEQLLSRCFLHLGGEQLYWECNALKASETFPAGIKSAQGLSSLLWEKVHMQLPGPLSSQRHIDDETQRPSMTREPVRLRANDTPTV